MIRIWPLDGASVEGGRPAKFIVVYLHVFITKPHELGSAYQSTIDLYTFSCHLASFFQVFVDQFLNSYINFLSNGLYFGAEQSKICKTSLQFYTLIISATL